MLIEAARELLENNYRITYHSDQKIAASKKIDGFTEIRVAYDGDRWCGSGILPNGNLVRVPDATSLDSVVKKLLALKP
jgi:hypothetical protein